MEPVHFLPRRDFTGRTSEDRVPSPPQSTPPLRTAEPTSFKIHERHRFISPSSLARADRETRQGWLFGSRFRPDHRYAKCARSPARPSRWVARVRWPNPASCSYSIRGAIYLQAVVRLNSMGFVILVIGSDPILGERFLCDGDVELPGADHVAYQALQAILRLGVPFRFNAAARLWPQV